MRNRVTQVNFIRIVVFFFIEQKASCDYACCFMQELVLDLLQSVVEIITYGDKHDPSILE